MFQSEGKMGKRVGIKSGCFSLIHAGHLYALEYARARCDHLIVLTNDNDKIRRKKGCVPIPLEDRMRLLKALRCVDEVGTFVGEREDAWVQDFKNNRLYQEFGPDAKLVVFHDPEVADDFPCKSIADEIIFITRIDRSVTDIFEMIKATALLLPSISVDKYTELDKSRWFAPHNLRGITSNGGL